MIGTITMRCLDGGTLTARPFDRSKGRGLPLLTAADLLAERRPDRSRDVCGRHRSPATRPGYHLGRIPANKGLASVSGQRFTKACKRSKTRRITCKWAYSRGTSACMVENMKPYERRITPWQERFWRYVTAAGPEECWEWQGGRNSQGYGRLGAGRRGDGHIRAHRASYELHHGPIPPGMDVCHRCDNPPCVNPAHLFVGTRRINVWDMIAKGRSGVQTGTAKPRVKVTDEQVLELRASVAAGVRLRVVAEQYGIGTGQVSRIARGQDRKNIGGPITHSRPGVPRKAA